MKIAINIPGIPAPGGSKTATVVRRKGGAIVMVERGKPFHPLKGDRAEFVRCEYEPTGDVVVLLVKHQRGTDCRVIVTALNEEQARESRRSTRKARAKLKPGRMSVRAGELIRSGFRDARNDLED